MAQYRVVRHPAGGNPVRTLHPDISGARSAMRAAMATGEYLWADVIRIERGGRIVYVDNMERAPTDAERARILARYCPPPVSSEVWSR
jgi:hypothetical protein